MNKQTAVAAPVARRRGRPSKIVPVAVVEQEKKQPTRMLKVACPRDGYTIRTTAKWLSQGAPRCGMLHKGKPCGRIMAVAEARVPKSKQ